jgi:predicted secreted protein with PEFG-CTERM motif
MITISFTLLSSNAKAFDAQVTIMKQTEDHCAPNFSCYQPFQVNISVGDTITWVNRDNRTHTVTTGTTNYGPEGVFDSGIILPGHSFTQFFGDVGKYLYYDKTDMWSSGIILVSKRFSHAELSWVPGSLDVVRDNYTSNGIIMTKQIQNTGNADSHSIIITLKIKNQTSLFYSSMTKLDIPANQSTPVKFLWSNPTNGEYQLYFDANSANSIGDMNANDDRSFDLISIPPLPPNQPLPIIHQNFTISNSKANIPEFGSNSYLILVMAIVSTLALSKKSRLLL